MPLNQLENLENKDSEEGGAITFPVMALKVLMDVSKSGVLTRAFSTSTVSFSTFLVTLMFLASFGSSMVKLDWVSFNLTIFFHLTGFPITAWYWMVFSSMIEAFVALGAVAF